MSFEYGYKWLHNRETIVQLIKELISERDESESGMMLLEEGQVLFEEGDYLEDLYILLNGEIELYKHDDEKGGKGRVVTDVLKPGAFIGVIAFTTGNRTMTAARVTEKSQAICIKREEFDDYLHKQHRLSYPIQQLMIANLVDRYQQNTGLQLKLERLNQQLRSERNELRQAYFDLEEAQNLLIHKEKMATLGQLVAGFAHEINNPVSALLRSSELVVEQLQNIFAADVKANELDLALFEAGFNSELVDTEHLRSKMRQLSTAFPDASRPVLRKLAQLPAKILEQVEDAENLNRLLGLFEAGKLLHNIRHASQRIGNLVKSLKSYSRPDANAYGLLDIREGIKDTVLMLSNRLKFHDVSLQLDEIPETCANMAELNQVWTNIICNACEAMGEQGMLKIRCWSENKKIIVEFEDSGPGVPEAIQERIFEPNFTTKNQSQKFGLGLGLAISSEIIKKHEGDIAVRNAVDGGAIFSISLPVKTDCK